MTLGLNWKRKDTYLECDISFVWFYFLGSGFRSRSKKYPKLIWGSVCTRTPPHLQRNLIFCSTFHVWGVLNYSSKDIHLI